MSVVLSSMRKAAPTSLIKKVYRWIYIWRMNDDSLKQYHQDIYLKKKLNRRQKINENSNL